MAPINTPPSGGRGERQDAQALAEAAVTSFTPSSSAPRLQCLHGFSVADAFVEGRRFRFGASVQIRRKATG
jgi:hypothetical protein